MGKNLCYSLFVPKLLFNNKTTDTKAHAFFIPHIYRYIFFLMMWVTKTIHPSIPDLVLFREVN